MVEVVEMNALLLQDTRAAGVVAKTDRECLVWPGLVK